MIRLPTNPDRNKNLSIAVIIPAYQAENHIITVIKTIPSFVTYIIVVDDCSPDHTADLVRSHKDKRIHLVSHEKNLGMGRAVITGYKKGLELGAKILVKMDGDGQMDPLYLPALIAPIRNGSADYTKGNRFLRSHNLKAMPLVKRIGNVILSFLTKLSSGYWDIFDSTNGYTAIHAEIIKYLDLDKIDQRHFFESSMLIELGIVRAVVKDIYIPARYKGKKSSISILDAVVRFPWKLLNGFLKRIITEYFVYDFNLISLLVVTGIPAILFGLVFGIANWARSAILQVPATTGTVMIAILPLILGFQFLLQALTLDVQDLPRHPLQKESSGIHASRYRRNI